MKPTSRIKFSIIHIAKSIHFIFHPAVYCVEIYNFTVCILIRSQLFGCLNKTYLKIFKLFFAWKNHYSKQNFTIKKNADIYICKFSGSFVRYGFGKFVWSLIFEPTK